jgi:hypothetical protein
MAACLNKQLPVSKIRGITLIGCGGTGSLLAEHLAQMIAGFRLDCELMLIDGDTVTPENLWRQNFAAHEVGQNKAEAMALRLGGRYGIGVAFHPHYLSLKTTLDLAAKDRLTITATDTLLSRKAVAMLEPSLWIDAGNDKTFGQARIGTTDAPKKLRRCFRIWAKIVGYVGDLPNEAALNPALMRTRSRPAKRVGCGQMPFDEQGFGINAMAALAAATLAKQAAVDGVITTAAIYFDCQTGRMAPRLIDREVFAAWR